VVSFYSIIKPGQIKEKLKKIKLKTTKKKKENEKLHESRVGDEL
jgi:hypothetical protein